MIKFFGSIVRLLTNNTGYSIKNWFIYGTFICGVFILIATVFVMVWDVVRNDQVNSNMNDIAQIILAVSALFTAAGLPKIVGEVVEGRNNRRKEEEDEELVEEE